MKQKIRTYSELITFPTFKERYNYLRLGGTVGLDTFGFDRIFNQMFYSSKEWKDFRREIILRDTGLGNYCCDLGVQGYEIIGQKILIHHLNPINLNDIKNSDISILMNPENVICTTMNTHNAIHYGYENNVIKEPIIRTRNDTCPWRK